MSQMSLSESDIRNALAGARERRRAQWEGVGDALRQHLRDSPLSIMVAPRDPSDGPRITAENLHEHALRTARKAVGSFANPARVEMVGVREYAPRTAGTISDATVMMSVTLRSPTGVQIPMDLPIRVVGGKMLDPSVVLVNGSPRIVAADTFRELMECNTAFGTKTNRQMFSPPRDNLVERREHRRNRGIFASKRAQDALRRVIRTRAFDTEFVVEASLKEGDEVRLAEDVEMVQPGGAVLVYEEGCEGTVLSVDGDECLVEMYDGLEVIIPMECLESGDLREPGDPPVGSDQDIGGKIVEMVKEMLSDGYQKADVIQAVEHAAPHQVILVSGDPSD